MNQHQEHNQIRKPQLKKDIQNVFQSLVEVTGILALKG